MRRRIQIVGWTFIWGGLFIFGYLGWQLFVTDLITAQVQAEAIEELDRTFETARAALPQVEAVEIPDDPETTVEYHPEDEPTEDAEFAEIRIPGIEMTAVVFEGVSRSTLTQGPGHMPGTPLPGQPGNSVISGHRTTYGRPFFDLDQLQPGDLIEVETAIGIHVYEVRESFVVMPTDVWVTDDRPGGWLTLTTCNPKFSARERLIVTAELVEGPNAEFVAEFAERFEDFS